MTNTNSIAPKTVDLVTLAANVPPMPLYSQGDLVVVSAPEKIGTSLGMLDLAISSVLGQLWLGYSIPRSSATYLVDTHQHEDTIASRIADRRISLLSWPTLRRGLSVIPCRGKLIAPDNVLHLLGRGDADLVIIDSLNLAPPTAADLVAIAGTANRSGTTVFLVCSDDHDVADVADVAISIRHGGSSDRLTATVDWMGVTESIGVRLDYPRLVRV